MLQRLPDRRILHSEMQLPSLRPRRAKAESEEEPDRAEVQNRVYLTGNADSPDDYRKHNHNFAA